MSLSIKVKSINVNYKKILEKRGLGSSNKALLFLANEVARRCDPYVPMRTGDLKNTYEISPDGRYLKYVRPYAQVQYRGKSKSGKPFKYNGAPMRGKEWDKRMMADHKKDVEKSLADFVGGKPK